MAKAELEITTDPVRAKQWIVSELSRQGATKVQLLSGVVGSVDALCEKWQMPDVAVVEIWSDNWTPLSLAGEHAVVSDLSERVAREFPSG